MAFRDRIKELRRVRIGDCEPHPLNYRTHPVEQGAAVTGLLQEVGIIDVALAFPADGLGPAGDSSRLMLYDGHLRQRLGPDQVWPVAVTDLTRAEANIVIATLHPTAEMAETDEDIQRELLGGLEAEEAELRKLIDEMMAKLERAAAEEQAGDEDTTEGPEAMYAAARALRLRDRAGQQHERMEHPDGPAGPEDGPTQHTEAEIRDRPRGESLDADRVDSGVNQWASHGR